MKLIPSRNQWEKWSLPSKLTAISAYLAVFGIILAIVGFIFDSLKELPATKSDVEEIINSKFGAYEAKLSQPAQTEVESEIDKEFAAEFEKKKKIVLELYHKGLNAYKRNDFDSAVTLFGKAINVFEIPSLFVHRGNSYFLTSQFEHAIGDYTKAIELNQNYSWAFNNRGAAWAERGDFNKAIADFTKALQIKPQFADAYYNRGKVFNEKDDVNQAINDLSEAIRIMPNNTAAFNIRGVAWGKKGDFDKAIEDFYSAIKIEPKYARAYYNRGKAFYNKSDYSQAIADYTKAIELNPNYSEAFNNRGLTYGKKGRLDKALTDCTTAIQINPQNASAYYNLACISSLLRRPIDACEYLRKAIKLKETFRYDARKNPDFDEPQENDCFRTLMNEGRPEGG